MSDHDTMKIGNYLRKKRMNEGYSQEYVAEILGISQKTYSNMENDRSNISFDTIKRLIEFYNIDVTSIDFTKMLTEGKLVEQKFETHDQSSGITINNISEKLILQMEERIEELKNKVKELEKINQSLRSKIVD